MARAGARLGALPAGARARAGQGSWHRGLMPTGSVPDAGLKRGPRGPGARPEVVPRSRPPQKAPLRLLSRIEELRLATNLADAGLLSAAEDAGVFSKLEAAGAFRCPRSLTLTLTHP